MRISDWSSDVCSSDLLGVFDISSDLSKQFAQEVRLQSDFSGPFNFSIGGNYTEFRTQNDYYVMSNLLTALARMQPLNTTATIGECGVIPAVAVEGLDYCPYIDPNPVDSINGEGHNYFRSSHDRKSDV